MLFAYTDVATYVELLNPGKYVYGATEKLSEPAQKIIQLFAVLPIYVQSSYSYPADFKPIVDGNWHLEH